MGRPSKYSQEFRERAVRLVLEQRDDYPSEFEAIRSVAGKLGVGSPETLRKPQSTDDPSSVGVIALLG